MACSLSGPSAAALQIREPDPAPLPAEGAANDASAADGSADPDPDESAADVNGDDGGYGDALAEALRKYFRASPRLLLPGDTFCMALPPVGPLEGVLATLSAGGSAAGSAGDSNSNGGGAETAAAAATADGQAKPFAASLHPGGGGGRLVAFRVTELRPAAGAAISSSLAIDPSRTAIDIRVGISTAEMSRTYLCFRSGGSCCDAFSPAAGSGRSSFFLPGDRPIAHSHRHAGAHCPLHCKVPAIKRNE